MLRIENNDDIEMKKIIEQSLIDFNDSKCEWIKNNRLSNYKKINFLVFDDDNLIGGAFGCIQYNWFFLNTLYVNNEYRNKYIGTELIKKIENFAKKENLTGIRMKTWDFQAKDFYEKNGYIVFGQVEDYPPGSIEFHLKKELINKNI